MPVNASSYPAPSAAAIAAAVAAPSAATIASTVAASVPTLSQINTSVANNAPSPNGWVNLGNASLVNVNSASVSFSAYRKLRVVFKFWNGAGGAQAPLFRFNGDTGTNYSLTAMVYFQDTSTPNANFLPSTDSIRMTIGNLPVNSFALGYMEIEDAASTSSHKQVKLFNTSAHSSIGNSTGRYEVDAVYRSNSAITSISLTGNGGTAFSSDSYNGFQVFGAN